MICPHCSSDNIDSANYCNRCGFQLRLNLCSECRNSNDESAKFCNHCGFEFENEDDANAGDAGGERAENQLISDQPGKSPQKAMNGYLIAGIVLLAIILSAGVPIFMGVQSWMETQAPIKVMQTYCNDLINNDAQGAYQQLTLKIQQQLSESAFAAGIETGLYPKDGGLKKCDIPKLVVNQHKRAVAFLDLTKGNGTVAPTIVDLVLENGTWKIEHPYGLGTDLS
ncbi:MAG TPA: zinc ribbon domain-containing protein [Ktedonobacteraceae bacterium]